MHLPYKIWQQIGLCHDPDEIEHGDKTLSIASLTLFSEWYSKWDKSTHLSIGLSNDGHLLASSLSDSKLMVFEFFNDGVTIKHTSHVKNSVLIR